MQKINRRPGGQEALFHEERTTPDLLVSCEVVVLAVTGVIR
jgi:hypothetical protein